MVKTKRPTDQDTVEVKRIVIAGLTRGDTVPDLAMRLAPLHPQNDTFPGEVLLGLGADALELASASREAPLAYEGLRDRFLTECEFRGRENRKLQYALLAVGALRGGIELDLLDEVSWWQTDDFWYYALCAFVAWTRAAADRTGTPEPVMCARLATLHDVDVGDLEVT